MWSMAYPIEDESEFVNRTALNPIAIEEAAFDFREYNKGEGVQDLSDQVFTGQAVERRSKIGMAFAVIRSRIWQPRKQGCGAFMRF